MAKTATKPAPGKRGATKAAPAKAAGPKKAAAGKDLLPAQKLEYIMMEDLLAKDPKHHDQFLEFVGGNSDATFVLNYKTAIKYDKYLEYMASLKQIGA